jgi:hypothetical protein
VAEPILAVRSFAHGPDRSKSEPQSGEIG